MLEVLAAADEYGAKSVEHKREAPITVAVLDA